MYPSIKCDRPFLSVRLKNGIWLSSLFLYLSSSAIAQSSHCLISRYLNLQQEGTLLKLKR
ncbi:MAG: hypothetical protein AB1589_44205 [Cyanobacteriota bacterium]